MDGTIADIASAVHEYREKYKDVDVSGIHYLYPWSTPGFFSDLKPLPNAINSVKKLAEFEDVWFLSRPSFKNTSSYTEKADWIKKYFGYEMQKKLILAGDKSLMMGDILVDDADNANQAGFKGTWIKYGSDEFPNWQKVLDRINSIREERVSDIKEILRDINGI